MRVYTVHIDPLSAAAAGGVVLVREGFSWPAALFTVLWALYHGLWGWALVLIAAAVVLGGGAELLGLDALGQAVLQLGYMAVVGYASNDWRRWALARRGFRMIDVVAGDDLDAAEQRYFEGRPALLP